ncbi:MAG: CDP-diacylglycerol--glycerol-3-phosphate 3-phosphatidyltransferase, partial [Myxococcota bacterium]
MPTTPTSSIREDLLNTPNLLTLFRIALIPVVCGFIYHGTPLSGFVAVLLFWVASITDWLDGYIARSQNLVSVTGKFLDPLADKLLVMATLVTLLPMGRIDAWLVAVLLGREMFITGLRAIASSEGIVIAAGEGGKFKTAFQMTGLLGLLIHYEYVVDYGFTTLTVNFHALGLGLLLVSLVFSISSAVEYVAGFLKELNARTDAQPPTPSDTPQGESP